MGGISARRHVEAALHGSLRLRRCGKTTADDRHPISLTVLSPIDCRINGAFFIWRHNTNLASKEIRKYSIALTRPDRETPSAHKHSSTNMVRMRRNALHIDGRSCSLVPSDFQICTLTIIGSPVANSIRYCFYFACPRSDNSDKVRKCFILRNETC